MRRIVLFSTTLALALGGFVAVAAPIGAQTGDGDAATFCQTRIDANQVEGKKANLEIMNTMIPIAPAGVAPAMTALRDAYQKKGDKLFDSPDGMALLAKVDAWVYDNCGGTKVDVTATDYEYSGIPATLPAGVAVFKMTNAAPKENHMLGIVGVKPAAQGQDLAKLLALPQKQLGKYFDESAGSFTYAPPGEVGYAPVKLAPGTYAYACFFPQAGKKNGKPHFMLGMYGSFTVQ